MYEDLFVKRLIQLRETKGVTGREMSLDIGQNASYINRIENRKAMPSMQGFLYICEYLNVTPEEFFRQDNSNPILINRVIEEMRDLNPDQINSILDIIKNLKKLSK